MNSRFASVLGLVGLALSLSVLGTGCADQQGDEEEESPDVAEAEGSEEVGDSADAIVIGGACDARAVSANRKRIPVWYNSTRKGRANDSVPFGSRVYLLNPDGSESKSGYVKSKNGSIRITWTMGQPAWIYYKQISCGG